MMKNLLLATLFYLPFTAQGQVTIASQLPPSGVIQKDALWNVMLINNSASTIDAVLYINLQDPATGQPVLSGGGRAVTLPKGVKMVSVRDVQPVQYNYSMPGYTGNLLPVGDYTICYSLREVDESAKLLATECIRLGVNSLSPVLLNLPADASVLSASPSQFSWIPPAPLEQFSALSYDLSIAEVLEGQTPAQAMEFNIPLYFKTAIQPAYENYAPSYHKLTTGKTYAWQVTARNGATYAQPTTVWTFSLSPDSVEANVASTSYIELKSSDEEAGTSTVSGTTLQLKYYSFDKEGITLIKLLDAKGVTVKEFSEKTVYGDNYLRLPLSNRFKRGASYLIELVDGQHKVYKAAFNLQ